MTHRFNITSPLIGITLGDARQCIGHVAFHEQVAQKLPGSNLKIQESVSGPNSYRMKKELNLDVNIPDMAKKLLKDAFRISRLEEWDIQQLMCQSRFDMNMPAAFRCQLVLREANGQLVAHQDWEVDVHVPLVHGILAKHAEAEIRRFNQIEMQVLQQTMADVVR